MVVTVVTVVMLLGLPWDAADACPLLSSTYNGDGAWVFLGMLRMPAPSFLPTAHAVPMPLFHPLSLRVFEMMLMFLAPGMLMMHAPSFVSLAFWAQK